MKVIDTSIPDVKIIEPTVFEDDRGFFFESFNHQKFVEAIGRDVTFVQDNHSKSVKSVLRGLHRQLEPYAQGKLVRVVQGEVFDVAVDVREGSSTFGHWVAELLSAENKKQLWIPEGFAHGFLTISETAEIFYKATNYYAPEYERTIRWDDPAIAVTWPKQANYILSEKDRDARNLINDG